MSDSIDKIKETLEALQSEIEVKVREAYDLGFEEGMGVTLPTQREFDQYHSKVSPYGEEHEWLVISQNLYTEEQALRRIRRYLKKEWGWSGDELPTELSVYSIGFKRYEGEPQYWLNLHKEGRWTAWGVETQ
jgi:hypothetical protein